MEELRKTALVAALHHHLPHFRINAGDFLEADFVDLLRAKVRSSVFANLRTVEFITLRKIVSGHRCTGLRDIFIAYEAQELAISRQNRLLDGRSPLGSK